MRATTRVTEKSKTLRALPAEGGTRANLRTYVAWKIVGAIILVVLVLTLSFYLLEVVPGDPTRFLAPRGGGTAGAENLRDRMVALWGLDQPVWDRYGTFVANILTGNWGASVTYRPGTAVWDILAPRLFGTFLLMGLCIFASASIGLALGALMARRRGGLGDALGSLLALMSFCVPVLLAAFASLSWYAITNPVFPVGGDRSINYPMLDAWSQFVDRVAHLALPLSVLVITTTGPFVLAVRRTSALYPEPPAGSLREALDRGTIRTLPTVPLLFGWIASADILVEAVFNPNGLGALAWTSLINFDTPLVFAVFLLLALTGIGVVTFFDVLHAVVVPVPEPVVTVPSAKPIELEDLGATAKHTFLRPMGLAGLVLLLAIVFMTLEAPVLAGPYPTRLTAVMPLLPASPNHPLGTDRQGYDVLTLLVYGGGESLLLASEVFLVGAALGIGVALASGYFGGWLDRGTSVVLDFLLILPWLPFAMITAMVAGVNPIEFGGLLVIVVASWSMAARLLRWSASKESGGDPVFGGRLPREPGLRGVARRLWTLRSSIFGYALMAASVSVLVVTALEFLGILRASKISWGEMISDSWNALDLYQGRWYAFFYPGLLVGILAFGLALLAFSMLESDDRQARRTAFVAPISGVQGASTPVPPPPP